MCVIYTYTHLEMHENFFGFFGFTCTLFLLKSHNSKFILFMYELYMHRVNSH